MPQISWDARKPSRQFIGGARKQPARHGERSES